MGKETKNEQLPGQMSMDINAARTTPTVKTVAPVKAATPQAKNERTEEKTETQASVVEPKKHYVQGEVLTETDLKKMTLREREQYELEKDAAYLKKAKEERERVRELRRKYREPKISVEETKEETPDELDEEYYESETDVETKFQRPKKNRQRNVCKKYRIKQRELRRGVERARELFVGKMLNNEKQRVVLAIIDLLEFGDIK